MNEWNQALLEIVSVNTLTSKCKTWPAALDLWQPQKQCRELKSHPTTTSNVSPPCTNQAPPVPKSPGKSGNNNGPTIVNVHLYSNCPHYLGSLARNQFMSDTLVDDDCNTTALSWIKLNGTQRHPSEVASSKLKLKRLLYSDNQLIKRQVNSYLSL